MKVVFFGTPNFAVPFLDALIADDEIEIAAVVTQPDKPAGRGKALKPSPVKKAAECHDINVHAPQSLKTEDIRDALRQYNAEVFIVVAYGQLIPEKILDMPPLGCVNVHPSLLPKYRGPAPMQAAIYHGDKETGVAIMKLDTGMDTGPLLDVLKVQIDPNETYPSLQKKIETLGPPFMIKTLKAYKNGNIEPAPQTETGASKTSLLSKSDGRIDWSRPAKAIEQKIRAYTPWPGTWTTWRTNDQTHRLKIHRAEVVESVESEPGTAFIQNDDLYIEAGEGALKITTLQPENKRKMTAQDFLNGHSDFGGAKLQ
jgi:methionyl-tRNA formyltransferase